MSEKPDLAERIGTAINELDIDFSRFTLVGWIVSLLSLGIGGGAAYFACNAMIGRNGLNLAAGLTFCLTIIAVTTTLFLGLRWAVGLAGLAVTQATLGASEGSEATSDALVRMAKAGMDLNARHRIDFWHQFATKDDAEKMAREARQKSFQAVFVEPNDESGGYDVLVQVNLVPTRHAISTTEKALGEIAERCNGHPDGWGVKQGS